MGPSERSDGTSYSRQSSTWSNPSTQSTANTSSNNNRPRLIRRTSSFEAHQAALLRLTASLPVKHLDLFSPEYDAMVDEEKADFFSSLHEIAAQQHLPSSGVSEGNETEVHVGVFQLLQIGMGSGATLRHYPQQADITVIDPNPRLMEAFRANPPGSLLPRNVKDVICVPTLRHDSRRGSVISLAQLETASFDVAVASLVLCATPDPGELLREIRRVLKPGGLFYFWEHCESPKKRGKSRLVQQAVQNSLIWPAMSGGCKLDIRPWEDAVAAGFLEVHYTVFSVKHCQTSAGRTSKYTETTNAPSSSRRMSSFYRKAFCSLYKYHVKGIAVN